MSGSAPKAKLVRVAYRRGESGWYFAKSPDMKGLLVAEPTMDALYRAIPQAIMDLYAACDEAVIVTRLDRDIDHTSGWVAVPAVVARRALETMAPSAR